jgi:hypothetical protein
MHADDCTSILLRSRAVSNTHSARIAWVFAWVVPGPDSVQFGTNLVDVSSNLQTAISRGGAAVLATRSPSNAA